MKCIVFHADLINSRNKSFNMDEINKRLYKRLCIDHNSFTIPKIILGDTFQFILELTYINEMFSIIRTIKEIFSNEVRIAVTLGEIDSSNIKKTDSKIHSHELPNDKLFYKSSDQFEALYKKRSNYNNYLKTNIIFSLTENDILNEHINIVYLAIENILNKWSSMHFKVCLLLSRKFTYKKMLDNFGSIGTIKYESQLSRTVSNKNIKLVLKLENSCLEILKEDLK